MGTTDSKEKGSEFPAPLELFVGPTALSIPENELPQFLFQLVSSLSTLVHEGKLDTVVPKLCQQLTKNNITTKNFEKLVFFLLQKIDQFIEKKVYSPNQVKAEDIEQTTLEMRALLNALFLMRTFSSSLIHCCDIQSVELHFTSQDGRLFAKDILISLLKFCIHVPITTLTYMHHCEIINLLIVLLSTQLKSTSTSNDRQLFYDILINESNNNDNDNNNENENENDQIQNNDEIENIEKFPYYNEFISKLLLNYIEYFTVLESPKKVGILTTISTAASSVIHLPWTAYEAFFADDKEDRSGFSKMSLGKRCLILLLLLSHKSIDNNRFYVALQSFYDPKYHSIQNGEKYKNIISFPALYSTIIKGLNEGEGKDSALLLFQFLYKNPLFRVYLLSQSDLDSLITPLLKAMYVATASDHYYHIDQILIISVIFLLLSEDKGFCTSMQKKKLPTVVWYHDQSLVDISILDMIAIILIKTSLTNLVKYKDQHLQLNCLAGLANIGQYLENMDPYTALRIVYLFEMTTRRYSKWSQKSKRQHVNNNTENINHINSENNHHDNNNNNDNEVGKSGNNIVDSNIDQHEKNEKEEESAEVAMYAQFLTYQFEMINSCLYFTLHKNPNFIYALLYSKHLFVRYFDQSNEFSDLVSNIKSVIDFFENQLSQVDQSSSFSSSNILEIIQKGLTSWRNVFFKFIVENVVYEYEEAKDKEEFFLPYCWSLALEQLKFWPNLRSLSLFASNLPYHVTRIQFIQYHSSSNSSTPLQTAKSGPVIVDL